MSISLARLSLAALAAVAVVPAQRAARLDRGLDGVRELMASGRWTTARDKLLRLLKEHSDEDYARARRADFEEVMRRCAFHLRHRKPRLDDLVSGRLRSHNSRTGRLQLTYRQGQLGDFDEADGGVTVLYHPLVFAGPHTITLRGRSYPREGVRIFVSLAEGRGYDVTFGWEHGRQFVPMTISRLYDDSREPLEQLNAPPLTIGKPFRASVQVDRRRIQARIDGKTILETENDGGFGRFALQAGGWDEVEISGTAQPSWLQGLMDARVEEQRAEFERTYDPRRDLPRWLYGPMGTPRPEDPISAKVYPGTVGNDAIPYLNRAMSLLNDGRFDDVVEFVGRGTDMNAPEPARAFLIAVAELGRNRPGPALKQINICIRADPRFWRSRDLRSRIYAELGRTEDAIGELKFALVGAPRETALYRALTVTFLQQGEPDAAAEVIALAKRNRVPMHDLEDIDRVLRMARHGPAWAKTYSHESTHYRVMSDIDAATCASAASILERAYSMFETRLGRAAPRDRLAKKLPVYLFSGEAGYRAYVEDIIGSVNLHTAGLYNPTLKQLLIWNLPDRETMMQTVRHEGFHQYFDWVLRAAPPAWLDEGLAEFYEHVERTRNGGLDGGQLRAEHIRVLRESIGRLVPLEQLLWMQRDEFYTDPELHYAQSWAFVHFLRKTTPARRRLFAKICDALQEESNTAAATRAALGDVDLRELDGRFREYAAALR